MASINPSEITAILQKELSDYQVDTELVNKGTVIQVGDGIARVYGLSEVMSNELVEFPGEVYGIALNLEEDNVGVVLLGSDVLIKEGDIVKATGRIAEVPVGEALIGRVVDPVGKPLDGKGPIVTEDHGRLEIVSPGVIQRQPVKEPLQTGIKAIDSMIPIGRGQRELIIGDRQTGKTALIIDTIINQKETDVYCIYVAVGQKASTVAAVYQVSAGT